MLETRLNAPILESQTLKADPPRGGYGGVNKVPHARNRFRCRAAAEVRPS
jgi:hypothetical protein